MKKITFLSVIVLSALTLFSFKPKSENKSSFIEVSKSNLELTTQLKSFQRVQYMEYTNDNGTWSRMREIWTLNKDNKNIDNILSEY